MCEPATLHCTMLIHYSTGCSQWKIAAKLTHSPPFSTQLQNGSCIGLHTRYIFKYMHSLNGRTSFHFSLSARWHCLWNRFLMWFLSFKLKTMRSTSLLWKLSRSNVDTEQASVLKAAVFVAEIDCESNFDWFRFGMCTSVYSLIRILLPFHLKLF